MPEGPEITAETLVKDGFGSRSFFECFVASANDKLVGFVLFYYIYCSWKGRSIYMEDLYVTPTYRKMGIGKKLWQACVRAGLDANIRQQTMYVVVGTPPLKRKISNYPPPRKI